MFDKYLNSQFKLYNDARKLLISQPQILIELERYLTELFRDALEGELENIVRDYN
jgi:hypothetical protein